MFQRRIKKGYTRTREAFKPLELQHFSPALVAQYVPETLSKDAGEFNDNNLFLTLFSFWQHEDIYRALAYAEREVIPLFRKDQRANLTSEKICDMIKNVHARAAATLFLDMQEEPGRYSTGEVLRWHYKRDFAAALDAVILKKMSLKQVLEHYDITHLHDPLDALIKKVISLKVEIPESSQSMRKKKQAGYSVNQAALWRLKLYHAYHQNKFTSDELELIGKIVIVCMLPENIPAKMEVFTQTLCQRIQQCDGSEDAVVSIAAFAFQQLTTIHCFSNGNGRTATNIMNDVLIGFEFPSIVMRNAGDADNSASSYSLAIQHMDKDITYLEKHIKLKLQEARKMDLKNERATFRLQLTRMAEGLVYYYTLLDIHRGNLGNANFDLLALHRREMHLLTQHWLNDQEMSKRYNGFTFQFSQQSHEQSAAVTIVNNLKHLSRIKDGWKQNCKNPAAPLIWLQDLSHDEIERAYTLLREMLKNTSAKVSKQKIKNSDKYIVLISGLTLKDVLEIAPSNVRKKGFKFTQKPN